MEPSLVPRPYLAEKNSLKGPAHDLIGFFFVFNSSTGIAARKAPGTYGEELNCLASGPELGEGTAFS